MPARRERIHVCPGRDGRPVRVLDFPYWWNRGRFFERFGGRIIDTGNPFWCDYGLLLTAGEASAWDRECRGSFAASQGGDSLGAAGRVEVEAAMKLLDELLKGAAWVIVESSEWESWGAGEPND